MNIYIVLLITLGFLEETAWSHARLTYPVPRNNNAGIKVGPCGGLARSTSPILLQGGKSLTILWEETVDHPGRYIFSLSMGNDLNFQQNILAIVSDQQNSGSSLPHRFQTTVTVPNIECSACTLQMIQSMEENPAAPNYYYSCADVVIAKSSEKPKPEPRE